jgi:hypothetical protein
VEKVLNPPQNPIIRNNLLCSVTNFESLKKNSIIPKKTQAIILDNNVAKGKNPKYNEAINLPNK